MHASFFNYNLTRPYPYKWFTPVALLGASILIVLLSVMNFVQNSYVLEVTYVDDPNSTITQGVWYSDWPSYLTSSVKPTCQPTNLDVNSQFFTNQSGLVWTITGVYPETADAQASPSLPYLNNILQDCQIQTIQMDFDGTRDRETVILQTTPWDVQVRAFVTCGIWSPMGYTFVNMTAMYDAVQPYTVAGSSVFVSRNTTARASMWWSEALLSAYWVNTAIQINQESLALSKPLAKGVAILTTSTNETDIRSLEFFDVTFNFIGLQVQYGYDYHGLKHSIGTYVAQYNRQPVKLYDPDPMIWLQVDSLAKSMYSAVLTDLGQTQVPSRSNIVATADTLQQFSSNFSKIAEFSLVYYKQLSLQDYTTRQQSANPTGPLELTRSVISTKYLCQVPKRKPLGDIFIAVLLADLVLLQAAWRLYTFGVDQVMLRMRPSGKWCERCVDDEKPHTTEADEVARGLMSAPQQQKALKGGSFASVVKYYGGSRDSSVSPVGSG